MNITALTLSLVFLPSLVSAQAKKPISSALDPDLKRAITMANLVPENATVDYVRLLDLGETTIKLDGKTLSVFRAAFRLNTSRARGLAEVNIPFNGSYEEVRVLRARTIRKNGTIVEVNPAEIRSTSPGSEYLMYDDAEAVGFSMPAVEEGCIIDYTFEKISRPKLLPGKFWTYWGFDGLSQVTLCRYRLTSPLSMSFETRAYNDSGLKPESKTDTLKKTKTMTWERKNLSRLQPELSMPQSSEVRHWMEISNIADWNTVAAWFWKLAKPQLTPNPALKTLVKTLTKDAKTEPEKAKICYDWICGKVRYVGIEFGLSAYQPHPVSEVHAKLYGDCKDKSALLISMLAECGIKSYPALLKTDDQLETEKRLPTLNAFNHCIVRANIEEQNVWLDPTAETCAYGDIPATDRGCHAMVVKEGKAEFSAIPLYAPEQSGSDSVADVFLDTEGGAKVELSQTWRGVLAQQMRSYFSSLPPDKRKEIAKIWVAGMANESTVTSFNFPSGTERELTMKSQLTFTSKEIGQKVGDLWILPIQLNMTDQGKTNPFPDEARKFSIVSRDNSQTQSVLRYHLPSGYAVQTLPETIQLDGVLQTSSRTAEQKAEVVEIKASLNTTAKTVPATEYAKIRRFFDETNKMGRAKLVLKRVK